ncbi:MAG: hypothetical protein HY699_01295 [Deltaproteobacteria bacterium]|nr:hypothetical protein [Deltaproteobacteria bacterium]
MHLTPRRTATAAGLLLLLQALLLVWMVFHRRINPDEGFYLAASRQVAAGQVLYRDYFYPQMPYLPYLFAPLVLAGLPLLTAARITAAACSIVLSWVLYRESARWQLSATARLALFACFVLHGLKLSTHATAITHAPSDLLAFVSFIAIERARPGWAGLCLGLAVGCRLPLLPLLPAYAAGLWWHGRARALLPLAAGFALALAPAGILALIDPANFIFGNYSFHALRGNFADPIAAAWQKAAVLLKWLLFPQNLLLLLVTAGAGASVPVLPAVACVLIGAALLQATPTYLIYAVQLLPFLFAAAAPGMQRLARHRRALATTVAVYVLCLLPTLGLSPISVFSEEGEAKNRLWSRPTVAAVVALIQRHSRPNDPVLSWWEGYPTFAGRPGYRGVGFWEANMARKLAEPQAAARHCLTLGRIGALISAGEPQVIVTVPTTWSDFQPQINARYERVGTIDAVQVYARRPLS